MTRDYKNINRKKSASSGRLQSVMTFVTGLMIGLLVALIVYMKEHQTVIASLQPPELIIKNKNKPHPVPTEIMAPDEARKKVPQPQYDFYKILPNMEVNVSEWEAKDQKATDPVPDTSGVYILQVGSFEQYDAADETKAHLALLGIKADIQRVVINGRDIRYRVRVGPYKDHAQLEKARKLLLTNNLDYVLLKLKLNDM